MFTSPGNRLQAHFGRYTAQLYIVLAVLAVGVLFGVLAINTLNVTDKLSLMAYVKQFTALEAVHPAYGQVFRPALAQNLKLIGMLYLLGVSVAGMPLVLAAIFFRGFVLGFSADFLVQAMHWQGAAVGLVTIGLDGVFLIPAVVLAASVALGFSWDLVSPRTRQDRPHLGRNFAFFTGLMVAMSGVTLVGTALETFAAPFLLHMLSSWGI